MVAKVHEVGFAILIDKVHVTLNKFPPGLELQQARGAIAAQRLETGDLAAARRDYENLLVRVRWSRD